MRGAATASQPGTIELELERGQAARFVVEQVDADLQLAISPSDGRRPWTIDMRERGVETATLIANVPTRFAVQIRPVDSNVLSATYEAHLEANPGPVLDRDRVYALAEQLETTGKAQVTDPSKAGGDAEATLREAAKRWGEVGDPTGLGTTSARLGDIHFARGRFDEAVVLYQHAVDQLRSVGLTRHMAILQNNLGAAHEQQGDFVEAQRHFQDAMDAWARLPGSEADRAVVLANTGTMFLRFGDYQAALTAYLDALPVLERSRRLNPALLYSLGTVHRATGDLEAAERYFSRALESLPEGHARRVDVAVRIAQLAFDRGNIDAAINGATDALTTLRTGRSPDPLAEANALLLQSQAFAAAGRLKDALAGHHAALTRFQRAGARRSAAAAWHHIGVVNRQLGGLAQSRSALTRALEFRRSSGLKDDEAETRYELGLLDAAAGRWSAAEVHLSAAIDLVDGIRGRVGGEYSRVSYLAARRRYFAAAVDTLLRLHQRQPSAGFANRAFEVAERQRARALADIVRDSGVVRLGADVALYERGRLAQRQLDFWAGQMARLSNGAGGAALEAARTRMSDAIVALREVDGQMRALPLPSGVAAATAVNIRDIQRQLVNDNTTLVSYLLGEPRSYAWVVTTDAVEVVTLPPQSEIEGAASTLLKAIRGRERTEPHASEMGRMVWQPIHRSLHSDLVLIAADGALQSVPFAALRLDEDGEPLVERHQLVMIPSPTVLLAQRARRAGRAPASRSIAVVADAVYERDDPRLGWRTRVTQDAGTFGRLMLSRAEGDWILSNVGKRDSYRAFGFKANRDTVLRDLGDYRIVHLAAHAVSHDTWPELSGVALSLFDDTGSPRDGMVSLYDIAADLELRADLVVLSACQTAAGPHLPGEGIMGLARGFIGAGASAVVGSLGTVLEEPTFEFMKEWYSRMASGQSSMPAFHAAQRAMRRHPRFAHPYYWSQFVYMGDPS